MASTSTDGWMALRNGHVVAEDPGGMPPDSMPPDSTHPASLRPG